ncbi:DDRGK domain-containing protein 1-like [Styela clava]|uniref:DDRGK domain-containing protein 1-like n=1 Tax=Styela clava TaxID=7725 RepID=UPI00193AD005|nr:DDRGK domain-containing protein 1-like [Styela clava]
MDPIVYVVAAAFVAVLLWFITRTKADKPVQEQENQRQDAAQAVGNRAGGRRRRNVRMGIQQHAQGARHENESENDEQEETFASTEGKIGAKKMKKLQEKEERKRMREQEALEREERKKEQAEREERQKLEDEKRLKEEEKIAEEKRKEQEEKERKEHEEYLELKAMFSVDEEGHQVINSESESQNMLMEFVDFVKKKKVVLLEDLASHFGLRTQDAIDRVQTMLKDEILTGVIDDRGKFIYISNEELKAVAKYITQRGRISISDLAQASNSLINLISDAVEV